MRIVVLVLLLFFFHISVAQTTTIIPPVYVKPENAETTATTQPLKLVITQQELAASNVTSLAQALQEFGNVQLQDITGNGSQVMLSLRGFGANASSNTLLLINGIPLTNPDLAPPDLNAVPLQNIKSVEIISGSESVLYGDQAVGGIINIVTEQFDKEKITTSCTAGSYQQKICQAALNQQLRNLRISFNALTQRTDNYRVHNDYTQNHVAGSLVFPTAASKLTFNYQLANENMQYPGALTAAQAAQNRRQESNDTDFFRDWNGIFHLQAQHHVNDNWHWEIDAARREMHGDGVLTTYFTQTRTIHFIKPQLTGRLGRSVLTSGLDAESDHYHLRSLLGVEDAVAQKFGLFSLANIPITERIVASAGVRGAQQNNQLISLMSNNTVNRALATTLGATLQINSAAKIYLRRADNFRFPKADENAALPPGVTQLRTQRGVSYESGMQLQSMRTLSKLGIYQLNLTNEIQFDPTQTPANPFGVNRNLDPTVRRGFFLSEKLQLTDAVALNGQYNFVDARFQTGVNAGQRIPLVAENIFRAGVNYQFLKHWNLYSEAIFTGNQFSDNDNANAAGKIGGYTLFDISLHYQWRQLSASLRVNNLFNKYYYFYTVLQPGLNSQFFYPAPGRNWLLTVKYTLL